LVQIILCYMGTQLPFPKRGSTPPPEKRGAAAPLSRWCHLVNAHEGKAGMMFICR